MRARMASRCGPILGRSQMMVTSHMNDDAALGRTSLAAWSRNFQRRRAAPAFVGGREMLADIAFADAAQKRVGDGMQPGIGIGMAFQPMVVRHLQAAEPDMIAVRESVHVIARCAVRDIAAQPSRALGQGEILFARHFDILLFAFDHLALSIPPVPPAPHRR